MSRVYVCRAPPADTSAPRPAGLAPTDVLDQVTIPSIITGTNATQFGSDMSPAALRDTQEYLLENVWQFCAFYTHVAAQDQKWTRWTHAGEWHLGDDFCPNQAYWEWRALGMANAVAVNVTGGERHDYCAHIWPKEASFGAPFQTLKCSEAKRRIYCALYAAALLERRQSSSFNHMQTALEEHNHCVLLMGPDVPFVTPQPVTQELVQKHLAQPGMAIQPAIVVGALLLNKPEWLA
jgi:hypothetical protein